MIFVAHGAIAMADHGPLRDDEAIGSESAISLKSEREGATVWRFELTSGDEDGTAAAKAASFPANGCRRTAGYPSPKEPCCCAATASPFPPGGRAYICTGTRASGIRCLIDGGIRIDTKGHSTSYAPGGAWFESGPNPVFAQAAAGRPTRLIRTMILPMAYLARSSVEYLNEEDKPKPKTQTYKIYVDMPVDIVHSPA